MAELSIIMPFVNEYPQMIFSIRGIAEELHGKVDFELLTVNNYCHEIEKQGLQEDKGAKSLISASEGQKWLRTLEYSEQASHWQAKNFAVSQATGKFLMFLDAHVMPGKNSISSMFKFYQKNWQGLNGSIHLPVTYQILEWRKLIYKLDVDLSVGKLHYTFDGYKESVMPYMVPAMSSCGMLIHRSIYDLLGGWPTNLGMWGGGEHFFNFAQAVLGKHVWIWPGEPLYHHADKRGYLMWRDEVLRNRCIATFLVGGEKLAELFITQVYAPGFTKLARERVLMNVLLTSQDHRELILKEQKLSIEDWITKW